jgi:D-tagatose-1,6-bisphosphate aldolase subunit GatZ/KbaZ
VAQRAARLCQAAEEVASDEQKAALTYVIGTEVPVPGGEASSIDSACHAWKMPHKRWKRTVWHLRPGLDEAMKRVIAIVVQPGGVRSHPNYSLSTAGRRGAVWLDPPDAHGL